MLHAAFFQFFMQLFFSSFCNFVLLYYCHLIKFISLMSLSARISHLHLGQDLSSSIHTANRSLQPFDWPFFHAIVLLAGYERLLLLAILSSILAARRAYFLILVGRRGEIPFEEVGYTLDWFGIVFCLRMYTFVLSSSIHFVMPFECFFCMIFVGGWRGWKPCPPLTIRGRQLSIGQSAMTASLHAYVSLVRDT